jgi:hypothetical protein
MTKMEGDLQKEFKKGWARHKNILDFNRRYKNRDLNALLYRESLSHFMEALGNFLALNTWFRQYKDSKGFLDLPNLDP